MKSAALQKINIHLRNKPLIYFTREIERAIGVEDLLKNYHIACIEDHYIVDQLLENNIDVFCAEKKGLNFDRNSTPQLLDSPEMLKWLRNITKDSKGEFYALVFQNAGPIQTKIQKLGGTLLNNDFTIGRKIEDKIFQYQILKENNISLPKGEIIEINKTSYDSLEKKYGKFVIQIRKSHTGKGTFIIENEKQFNNLKKEIDGSLVKITKFEDGDIYTINGCILNNQTVVSPLQYQITGLGELAANSGTTVGNDWNYPDNLQAQVKDSIKKMVTDVGNVLMKDNYKGIFGLDLIINEKGKSFLIEINPRQTANIAMQSALERKSNYTPMMILDIATKLGIDVASSEYPENMKLNGSQIFLRCKISDQKIAGHQIKSGVYRLQSDNESIRWKEGKAEGRVENAIFIDEENDKPLIWQKNSYRVDQVDGGFLLFTSKSEAIRHLAEEIARMQFDFGIIDKDKQVKPWILEAFRTIEELLK